MADRVRDAAHGGTLGPTSGDAAATDLSSDDSRGDVFANAHLDDKPRAAPTPGASLQRKKAAPGGEADDVETPFGMGNHFSKVSPLLERASHYLDESVKLASGFHKAVDEVNPEVLSAVGPSVSARFRAAVWQRLQ